MGEERRVLALRKEVLRARSALQRLQIARASEDLRASLSPPRAIAAFVTSRAGRSLVVALLLGLTARRRRSRLLRAAAIVAAARIARAFAAGSRPAPPEPRAAPEERAAAS